MHMVSYSHDDGYDGGGRGIDSPRSSPRLSRCLLCELLGQDDVFPRLIAPRKETRKISMGEYILFRCDCSVEDQSSWDS